MEYESRITADPAYLQALGQAFYNFTYLEWVVIWTIVKLSANGFDSVPRGQTASYIAAAFIKALDTTYPPLPPKLRLELAQFHKAYLEATKTRNQLLHAHPYTAQDGAQQLGSRGVEWPIMNIHEAAKQFEDAAIMGNDVFHGKLASARP